MSLPEDNQRRWIIESADEEAVREFAVREGLPYLPALILYKRGYRDTAAVKRFLEPALDHLHDPFGLPDMDRAVDRLVEIGERGEKVLVHGDYDVDGVSGTALLLRGLKGLGIEAEPYLPHRVLEGYGLSAKAIDAAQKYNASLILTVDSGVSAIKEAGLARDAGIDLIVTDHHEPLDVLPQAIAVVDPKRKDSSYPFKELCGTGVAYKLLAALRMRLEESFEPLNNDLDLVALGTIADVVPLLDENRIFAYYGLQQISRVEKTGLRALLGVCGLGGKQVTAFNVAFGLAPRLNASGRMADALAALRLLLTDDPQEAQGLALELDNHNEARKRTEEAILEEARVLAEYQIKETNPRVLVCYSPSWHEGVIGIVASRLVERFYRPTVMLAEKEGRLKGSARSVPGFHIQEALVAVSEYLVDFGGHEAAAGMVLEKPKLPGFIKAINDYAERFPDEIFEPKLHLDADAELCDLDDDTKACFERFRPFGMGNPQPRFATYGLEVVGNPRVLGRKHLKFTVRKNNTVAPAIAFGKAELILELEPGRKEGVDLAYRIDEDAYWGKRTLKLIAEDVRVKYKKEKEGG